VRYVATYFIDGGAGGVVLLLQLIRNKGRRLIATKSFENRDD
jgi:hypothetical protein